MDKTKLFINSVIKGVADETNRAIMGVVGSTGVIDRQGESLNPNGWVTDNYTKNPVVLYGHNYKDLPIGKATRVWIENGSLMFDIAFADTAMAKDVFNLMKDKFLNAVSVGFIPLEFDATGQYTYAKQELLELSVVPVPANPEALSYIKSNAPALSKALEENVVEEKPADEKPTETVVEEKPIEEKPVDEQPKPDEQPVEKQGRVLSQKNEDALRSAYEAIGKVLSTLEGKDGEETVVTPETPKDDEVTPEVPKTDEVKIDNTVENSLLVRLHKHMKQADKEIGQGNRLFKELLKAQKGGE